MSGWLQPREGAVDISIRLTPGASVDSIDGLVEDAAGGVRLKARVRAVPESGKANKAIEKLIAKRLGLAKTLVTVVSGETSRSKTIRISGDPEDLAGALSALARP